MTKQSNTNWVNALKIAPRHFSVGGTPAYNNRVKGWNDCIDYLAEHGMIVPDGWVAVPMEPTSLMKIEGQQKINQIFNTAKHLMNEAGEIYSAMLASAPKIEVKK